MGNKEEAKRNVFVNERKNHFNVNHGLEKGIRFLVFKTNPDVEVFYPDVTVSKAPFSPVLFLRK